MRIGFAGPAAQGFAPGREPTGRDILDLIDVELWAVYGAGPTPSHWVGPMATVLFGVLGAEPEEVRGALAVDLPRNGRMVLRSRLGVRMVPVPEWAARVLERGAREMAKIARCDRLIVNVCGLPLEDRTLRARFEVLAERIRLPSVSLIVGLRAAYRRWIRLSDDDVAIRHLCDRLGRGATLERLSETTPIDHLSAIVDEYHPLGRLPRPLTHHRGAVERAHPDRAFRELSEEARRDVEAARIPGQRRWCYPGELIGAVTAAWDGGRTVAEIVAHYGVSLSTVDVWIKAHRAGGDPSRLKQPLSVRSVQEAVISRIRPHPGTTAPDVKRWLSESKGINVSLDVVRKFAKDHGLRLSSAGDMFKSRSQRKKLLRFLEAGTTPKRACAYARQLGLSVEPARMRAFGARNGIEFQRKASVQRSEPARSLLVVRMTAHPRATARQTAEWLFAEHGIEVDPACLPRFADGHGLKVRRVKIRRRRIRTGPGVLEANRDALLGHISANPGASPRLVHEWARKVLRLKASESAVRRFCDSHGFRFGRVLLANEADRLLPGYLAAHPGVTRSQARRWLQQTLGRKVTEGVMGSFARRNGIMWGPRAGGTGGADDRERIAGFIADHPEATARMVAEWTERALGRRVSEPAIGRLTRSRKLRLAPAYPLGDAESRRRLAEHLAKHPGATHAEIRNWCARTIGPVGPGGLHRFARRCGHRFAPAHHTPEEEPYRGGLLKWMKTHPDGTAAQASAWAFRRFAADFTHQSLHGFAARRGLRFARARTTPSGAAAELRRRAAQLRPGRKRGSL